MTQFLYIILGLVAGILSGAFGIGGGTILIPVLVFLFGLTQHQAQGTTLAILVPPIGLLAALRYYYSGNVKLDMAALFVLDLLSGVSSEQILSREFLTRCLRNYLAYT